jgi:DNA-binding CsgD family transcriptional regulator
MCECALLSQAIDGLPDGVLHVVVLEGEPGIGKSALLAQLRRLAATAGMTSWYGAADELERHHPLRALRAALGQLPEPAGVAVADGAPLTAPAEVTGMAYNAIWDTTFLAVEAALDMIERAAAEGPVLLALEDLQWADPATLLALSTLVRRLASLPVLLAFTLRAAPQDAELSRLLALLPPATTQHIVLAPLDEPAAAELAARVLPARPGPRLLARVNGAGGNPFYLLEMLRSLTAAGWITVSGDVADLSTDATGGMPDSLRRTLQRRIGTLSAEARDLLRLAAVLGVTFLPAELAQLAGRPLAGLLPALGEATAAGVLDESGDRLAFRHQLMREALYAGIPAAVRTALHRDVGRVLAAAGAPAERVAVHLSLGARAGDREAVSWLRRAARRTAAASPAAAADLLSRAAELCAEDDPDRDVLIAELATALTVAGRSAEAVRVARAALAGAAGTRAEGSTRLALAQGLWAQGLIHEWMAAVEEGLRVTPMSGAELARFHAEAAGGHLTLGQLTAAEENAQAAIEGGRAANDDLTVCLGLSALSIVAEFRGDFLRAVDLGTEVVQMARQSARPELGRRYFYAFQALFLLAADRPDQALEALRAGRALSAGVGVVADLPVYHHATGLVHYSRGRWEEAAVEAETALAVAAETNTRTATIGAASVLAHIAVHRGAFADAERLLAQARATARESGPQWGSDWMVYAEATLHEARGRPADALALLAGAWHRYAELGMEHVVLRIGPDLVRLLVAAGGQLSRPAREGKRARHLTAAEVVDRVVQAAARAQVASADGAALRARGLVSGDPELLLSAAEHFGRGPRAISRAQSLEEAAIALANRGRGADAGTRFAEALAEYDALGAAHDVARATAAQRAAGIRRGVRGSRRRPASGWASLTATELQVARLAAEGLTNPQIAQRLYISRYTVETHLKHVFAKLSLTSRVQLAAEVARRAG